MEAEMEAKVFKAFVEDTLGGDQRKVEAFQLALGHRLVTPPRSASEPLPPHREAK